MKQFEYDVGDVLELTEDKEKIYYAVVLERRPNLISKKYKWEYRVFWSKFPYENSWFTLASPSIKRLS